MFSFTSASSLLFLLSGVVIADIAKPLGLYTPRGFKTESIRAELEFLKNDRVKYNIRAPMLDSKTVNSYSIAMVSSSLIRVTVDEQQQQYWEQFHPGQFSREGYTLFGYDPVKNRVTMVTTGDAFEVLHESDPAKDAGPLTDVTKPSGVYRVEDGGLSMTMEFKQVGGNDRVHYHIKYGEKEYSSLLDPAFLMLSSSMVRVEILESDLFRLHGTFPGLSRDFFYMNLGYDPVANVITFVLDSYLGVKLVYSPTTTPTPTLPQTTAHVAKPLGLYTPRGFKTESIRAELEFLKNDRVKYNIRAPMLDSKTVNSYSIAMVSSSLIRVTVDEQQQQYWEQFHPGQFSREGYTLFGYDPVKNRVTMVTTGDAFEVLHESDPAKDAGPLTDVTKPSGVYRVEEGGLSMTMEFKQVGGNDRVHYHIKYGEKEYSSLLDPAFLMLSSSMVRVEILESDLFRLHGTFPGLSRDFFYMNLGYDPVANVITFVLDSYLGVKLVYSPTTTPTPTLPQTTAHVAKPLGLYTPRGFKTESIRAELEFLKNDRVKYNIRAPMLDSKTVNSYSIAMVSSSLIRVTVDEQQQQYWEQFHPGQFSREGYTLFGYDPVKNRVTMVTTGDAFEVLHESDPAKDAGPLTDVTKPSGVYRVEEGGLSMTMEFKQVGGNDRVHYHIKYGEKEYSSLLDPAFLMLSSSMVRVEILESDLFRLHGTFPGLSRDFFYMNLGYDPVANVITFVLDSYLGVKLVYSPTTTPTPTLPQTTTPPTTTAPPTEQPFGDFCTSRGAAQFSVRFTSDYTATVAGVMGDGRHFIARDALYDIHDNVVSVNVVNSDLYTILRRIDWFGLETLNFTYNPIDNRLFLAERGQNAQLFQLLGCAAPIENYSDGKLVVVDDDGEEDPKLDFPEAVMQAVQDVIDFIFGKD